MPKPVLLADTELLFTAGVAATLATDAEFELLEVQRDSAGMHRLLSSAPGAICILAQSIAQSASEDLPRTAAAMSERGQRLILLVDSEAETINLTPACLRGVLRRNASREDLMQCLHTVAVGGVWTGAVQRRAPSPASGVAPMLKELTPRQLRTMGFVTQGMKNAEIAQYLHTSEQVVKNLLRSIYDRTGVSDRLELALYVLHHPELARAASIAASQPPAAQGSKD